MSADKPANIRFGGEHDEPESGSQEFGSPFGVDTFQDESIDSPERGRVEGDEEEEEVDEPFSKPTKKKGKGFPGWMLAACGFLFILFVGLFGLIGFKLYKAKFAAPDEEIVAMTPQPQIINQSANGEITSAPPQPVIQATATAVNVQADANGAQVNVTASQPQMQAVREDHPEVDYSAQASAQSGSQPSPTVPTSVAGHAVNPSSQSAQTMNPVQGQSNAPAPARDMPPKMEKASFVDQTAPSNVDSKEAAAIRQAMVELAKRIERTDADIKELSRIVANLSKSPPSSTAAPIAAPKAESVTKTAPAKPASAPVKAEPIKKPEPRAVAKPIAREKSQESAALSPKTAKSAQSDEIVVHAPVERRDYVVTAAINNRAFIAKRNPDGTETELSVTVGDKVDGVLVVRVEGRTVYLANGQQITVGRR